MKNLLSLFIFLFFTFLLNAQEQSFTASVSQDTILLGNTIELRFEMKNLQGQFEAPDLSEINIVSGPNVQSSMQFINGTSTQSMTYSYLVKPQEIGAFVIQPAYLDFEGGFETEPIELIVIPNPDGIIEDSIFKQKDIFGDRNIFDLPDFNFDFGFPEQLKKKQAVPKDTVSKYKLKRI